MNIIEIAGFITGIAGVWLTIRQNVWCFPVGLANVVLSFFLFVDQKLYSDAVQQIFYVILLSYGWFNWKIKTVGNQLEVTFLRNTERMMYFISAIIIALVMGSTFRYFTDAHVPYLDAAATSLSFVAQFLIAKKKIENWLVWIIVNVMYIGIYFYKDLYLYAALFTVYLFLAVNGFISWKKSMIPS